MSLNQVTTAQSGLVCPLCGSASTIERSQLSQILSLPDSVPQRVRQCRDCGFKFLAPYLSERDIEDLYSGQYFAGESSEFGEGSGLDYEIECAQVRLEKFERTIDDLLSLHPGAKTVLDVGAATGEFLHLAQTRGLFATGLELSQWACERASEKYGFHFSNEPFEDYSPNKTFDLIHASHVLEHFPNPNSAASKFAELLAPNGLVYIEVPFQFNAAESVANRAGLWSRPFSTFSLHHPSFFTPVTLERLFARHKLKARSIRCFNWDRHGHAPASRSKRIARSFLKLIGQGQIIEGVFEHA